MSGDSRWTSGPSRSVAVGVLLLVGVLLVVVGVALPRHEERPPRIAPSPLEVLALGDSLSRGVQPVGPGGRLVTTDRGYPPLLVRALRERHGEVVLVEAGCPDADTATLVRGGACDPRATVPYANDGPSTSQVAWAARRLRARRDAPTLVTLDVGGNDLLPCLDADRAKLSRCLRAAEPGLTSRLRTIARRLRAASGSRTVLVGATVYDPYVGLLRVGGVPRGAVLALHRAIRDRVNPRIARVLRAEGWEVAELGRALGGNAPLVGEDPEAVRAACAWTWMCALTDVHLNDRGYARAARLVDRVARPAVDRVLGG